MKSQDESIVLNTLLARRENYDITHISHTTGRYYDVVMQGRHYNAVVLFHSFEYYLKRYHLADIQPNLCVSMVHDTVLPIPVMGLLKSNRAEAYELPEAIVDIDRQRRGKIGSQVLLGQYILGVHHAVDFVEGLKPTTRKRYQQRARQLAKREPGRPVGVDKSKKRRKVR